MPVIESTPAISAPPFETKGADRLAFDYYEFEYLAQLPEVFVEQSVVDFLAQGIKDVDEGKAIELDDVLNESGTV